MKDRRGLSGVVIASTFLIFAIAMIFVSYYIINYQIDSNVFFGKYNTKISNELKSIMESQEKMDNKIKDISENGGYTIEEPCIINNPYEISPLSSIAIFNTKEEVSVHVYINDEFVTSTKKTKNHIIPIYGLYSHTNNVLKLVTSNNEKYETIIKTNSYNFNINDFDYTEILEDKKNFFLVGNIKNSKSNLRGFDHNANLIFYLDLDYINSVTYKNDHIFVGYNSKFSSANLESLKIELDYLGKIYSISKDTNELMDNVNIIVNDEKYVGYSANMYKDEIENFKPVKILDNNVASEKIQLLTSDIEESLINADVYKNEYDITLNGDYLTFDFKDMKGITLAIVGRDATYTYLYNIDGKNSIKLDLKGDLSLYLKIDNNYYSLLTTLNN